MAALLFVSFLQVSAGVNSTEHAHMHPITRSHPPSSYVIQAGFLQVRAWKKKNSTWISHQIVLQCSVYVVEICEKRQCDSRLKVQDMMVVFIQCIRLSVTQIGRSLLLTLQIEMDIAMGEDCEESCRRWNGSKRRRRVLFFDVHHSRRTPCQILDYTVDRYASESEVHLGTG